MRLGVLDVGSNTVHLLVVDAHHGAHPWPAHSEKVVLRLAEQIGPDGALTVGGADGLVKAVGMARAAADGLGAEDLLAFATSAVRDATNAADVLARVRDETGVRLEVLSGADEARMTFLAVRRWFGWSAGRLLAMDIGGGSLELAAGIDEHPDVAISLPLGAGRLSRERLAVDPAGTAPPSAAVVVERSSTPCAAVSRSTSSGESSRRNQKMPAAPATRTTTSAISPYFAAGFMGPDHRDRTREFPDSAAGPSASARSACANRVPTMGVTTIRGPLGVRPPGRHQETPRGHANRRHVLAP